MRLVFYVITFLFMSTSAFLSPAIDRQLSNGTTNGLKLSPIISKTIISQENVQYTGNVIVEGALVVYNSTLILESNSFLNVRGNFSLISSSLVIIPNTTPLLSFTSCPQIINSNLIVNFNLTLSSQSTIQIMEYNATGCENVLFLNVSMENVDQCYEVKFEQITSANSLWIIPNIMDLCGSENTWILPIIICSCIVDSLLTASIEILFLS